MSKPVRLPKHFDRGPLIGKLNEALEYRQKASVSVYRGSPTAGESDLGFEDTGVDVDVWDFFLDSGSSLASGAYVTITWFSSHKCYIATNAVCN